MTSIGNLPVTVQDNTGDLNHTARQSPQTYVRDVVENSDLEQLSEPVRERNVPIRLTHEPAPTPPLPLQLSSRFPSSLTATPAEKVPFLQHTERTKDSDPAFHHQKPDRLALVHSDNMTDNGVAPRAPAPSWQSKLARVTRVNNIYLREFLAEFLGSFILIIFGNGAVAEVVLSKKQPGGSINDFFSINVAYGLAVGFGVYIAGGVSGGHLNPAVTLAFALKGALKWIKVPIYWAGQYLGCIVGSAVIYAIYYDAFNAHDGGYRSTPSETPGANNDNATAGIFASYPQAYLSWQNGLVDQIFATSFLMIGVLALTDDRNMSPHKGVVPILVALLITAIGLSYGYNCGYPINPARDLGPRIFTSMAGWGLEPFSFRNHNWFWVPVIGPHLGAIMGLGIYQFFIGNQWPPLQRTGIELQVVRKGIPDEYELVKSSHVHQSDANVPVTFRTNDGTTERLLTR